MALFLKMLVFFILIVVGYFARRWGMITKENQPQLSALAMNIACPAMILSGAFAEGERMSLAYAAEVMSAATIVQIVLMIAAEIIARLMRFPKHEQGVIAVMTVFTNIMFMGLPIVGGIYGDSVVIYFSIFLIPGNLLLFTYGVRTVSRGTENRPPMNLRQLLSPCVVASILSLILFFVEIPVPDFIISPIKMLGTMMPPLGMLLIGSSIHDVDFRKVLGSPRVLVFVAIKMIILPTLILLSAEIFIKDTFLLATIFAMVASSSATFSVILTILYNKEAQPLATAVVSFSSAIAVLTMPLVALLAGIG